MKGDIIPGAGHRFKSHKFPREKRGQLSVWSLMANVETHSLEIAVVLVGGWVLPESWKLLGLGEGGDQNGHYYDSK